MVLPLNQAEVRMGALLVAVSNVSRLHWRRAWISLAFRGFFRGWVVDMVLSRERRRSCTRVLLVRIQLNSV